MKRYIALYCFGDFLFRRVQDTAPEKMTLTTPLGPLEFVLDSTIEKQTYYEVVYIFSAALGS